MQETTNSNRTTHSIANSSESYEESYEDRESRDENRESRNAQTLTEKHSLTANCSIDLEELITALESTDDQSCGYFDTKTGEIKWVYDFDPSLSDISSEEFEADEGNNRYIALTDCFEINEYHMMEAFAYDGSEKHRDSMIRAITGRGAFRRFRNTLDRLGLSEEWNEFWSNCYRERAIDWCYGNKIKFFDNASRKNRRRSKRGSRRTSERSRVHKNRFSQEQTVRMQ